MLTATPYPNTARCPPASAAAGRESAARALLGRLLVCGAPLGFRVHPGGVCGFAGERGAERLGAGVHDPGIQPNRCAPFVQQRAARQVEARQLIGDLGVRQIKVVAKAAHERVEVAQVLGTGRTREDRAHPGHALRRATGRDGEPARGDPKAEEIEAFGHRNERGLRRLH